MRIKTLAVICACTVAVIGSSQNARALELQRTQHPRMLLYGAESMQQIYERTHDQPWYAEIREHVSQTHPSNFEVIGRQLETKAAVYAVERSQGFNEVLYRQALTWLRTENLPHDPWNGANWYVVGQCLLLDAMWNDLDAQGDRATRDAAVEVVIDSVNFLNEHVNQSPWVCCDYGNQAFLRMLPVYPAAILLRGHGTWDAQVDRWWDRMEDFLGGSRNWLAAAGQMTRGGGGWPEGYSYHMYCGGQIAMVCAAIHSATDLDLMQDDSYLNGHDVFRQSEYYLWTMLPGRRYFNFDNGPNAEFLSWGEKPFHLCAYGLAGPSSDVTRELLANNPAGRFGKDVAGPFVLAFDPSVSPSGLERLPKSRLFAGPFNGREYSDGAGTFVWRSGWGEHATVFILHARNRFTGHQHADAGSFYLFREGSLVTENYGKPNAASEHHNTYLIDNAGMEHGNNPHRVFRQLEDTPFDEGDVLAHETSDAFTYAKVSFGRSYPNSPDLAQREVVVLHPRQDSDDPLFVIADTLQTSETTDRAFLMHTVTRPTGLDTNTIAATRDGGKLFARVVHPAECKWQGEQNGSAFRNRIEQRGGLTQQLTVLQASTIAADEMIETRSIDGVLGVVLPDRCVLFLSKEQQGRAVTLSHAMAGRSRRYVVCGLMPNTSISVRSRVASGRIQLELVPGTDEPVSQAGIATFEITGPGD